MRPRSAALAAARLSALGRSERSSTKSMTSLYIRKDMYKIRGLFASKFWMGIRLQGLWSRHLNLWMLLNDSAPQLHHGGNHHQNNHQKNQQKTYNTRDSLVVTDPTTSLALTGLSMGERTGSRIFQWVWSYVSVESREGVYDGRLGITSMETVVQHTERTSLEDS
ncbi:hypothetical protein B0T16DRAFT_108621 [Cercophora newfieldiana]|uniref:Uncharacterized protein n=1 Tax=Cercophora newfieldiana TaxID=92897 RepID=A0AA40CVI6_9PEZI|nr:hypothetical protein B0T16DRAFT_108621 [Cercophora newfieldiana]